MLEEEEEGGRGTAFVFVLCCLFTSSSFLLLLFSPSLLDGLFRFGPGLGLQSENSPPPLFSSLPFRFVI